HLECLPHEYRPDRHGGRGAAGGRPSGAAAGRLAAAVGAAPATRGAAPPRPTAGAGDRAAPPAECGRPVATGSRADPAAAGATAPAALVAAAPTGPSHGGLSRAGDRQPDAAQAGDRRLARKLSSHESP